MKDKEKPIVINMTLDMPSVDRPQVAVMDSTNSPKKSGTFTTSEDTVTLWFKNPGPFSVKAEIIKDGKVFKSLTLLTHDIKEIIEKVEEETNYVINFYKQGSRNDSEVDLEGIEGMTVNNVPISHYSFNVSPTS